MIPSQVRRELEDILIQWLLARSVLLPLQKKKSSGPRDGCFKCGGAHFQRDCNVNVCEHIPIELRPRCSKVADFIERPLVSAFLMVELGSFKVTMRMVGADL